MIDLHFVDDRHVELVENERLDHVCRELGVPIDHGHGTRAPAFVGDRELRAATESEGRNDFEVERVDVIVENNDRHVGFGLGHPLLRRLVTFEQRCPVRLSGLAVVDGGAERGRVGGADSGDDFGHQPFLSDFERQPLGERPPANIMFTYSVSVTPAIFDAMC